MNLKQLQEMQEQKGNINNIELLTDVIAKGTTIFYGNSGAGKTYSVLKHLNRFKIKPLLVDFDNNPRLTNFDYYHFDGALFFDNFNVSGNVEKIDDIKKIKAIHSKLDALLAIMYKEYPIPDVGGFINRAVTIKDKHNILIGKYAKNINFEEDHIFYIKTLTEKIDKIIIVENNIEENNYLDEDLENETIIIDTYQQALKYVNGIDNLIEIVNKLLRLNNNVIIIAHTTGERDKYLDMNMHFANNCDCKLKLNRDITKTKEPETYLTIEKLRTGGEYETMIKNWER